MNKSIERIIRTIETWFFGKYFQDLTVIHNLEGCAEYFNSEEEKVILKLFSNEECIEFMKYFNVERELYDSKYSHMGTYKIKMVKFVHVTDDLFLVELYAVAIFSELDWDKVKNTEDILCKDIEDIICKDTGETLKY